MHFFQFIEFFTFFFNDLRIVCVIIVFLCLFSKFSEHPFVFELLEPNNAQANSYYENQKHNRKTNEPETTIGLKLEHLKSDAQSQILQITRMICACRSSDQTVLLEAQTSCELHGSDNFRDIVPALLLLLRKWRKSKY